jgi:hypothetical protein
METSQSDWRTSPNEVLIDSLTAMYEKLSEDVKTRGTTIKAKNGSLTTNPSCKMMCNLSDRITRLNAAMLKAGKPKPETAVAHAVSYFQGIEKDRLSKKGGVNAETA